MIYYIDCMESERIIKRTLRLNNVNDFEEVACRVHEELGISGAEIRYLEMPRLVEVKGVYQGAYAVLHIKLIDRSLLNSLLQPHILEENVNKILGVSDARIGSRYELLGCNPAAGISRSTITYTVRWSSQGRERRGSFSIVTNSLDRSESPEEYVYNAIKSGLSSSDDTL